MGCMETALEPDPSQSKSSRSTIKDAGDDDVIMEDAVKSSSPVYALARELLFRCFTCKRLAHYSHLPTPPMLEPDCSVADIAEHYQRMKSWLCADCSSYRYSLDKILAWRPYPADAVEVSTDPKGIPNYKAQLPREYLVKWSGRSYRRVQWVPHMWLVSTNPLKLKNFISGGSKVELLQEPAVDQDATEVDVGPTSLFENEPESRGGSVKASDDTAKTWLSALPDAERRIPLPWKNVDRVLDIVLWRPTTSKQASRRTGRRLFSKQDHEDSSNVDDERVHLAHLIFEQGEEPPAHLTETVKEWETHSDLEKSGIDHVVWAFIKWEELGYDEGKALFVSYTQHLHKSKYKLHGMLLLGPEKITMRVLEEPSINLSIHGAFLFQSMTALTGMSLTTVLSTVFENIYCKTLQSWTSVLLLILNSCRSR